jgi:hypothetical protein
LSFDPSPIPFFSTHSLCCFHSSPSFPLPL